MICGQSSRPGTSWQRAAKHVTTPTLRGGDSWLVSVRALTLEECMEFIDEDELLEVTPQSLRMRKRELNHELRAKGQSRGKKQ